MFDDHAKSLFQDFDEFDNLDRDHAVRALSSAYLAVVQIRLNGGLDDVAGLSDSQPYLRRLANTLIFHVVLDASRDTAERQAASFVAAEAIALMADYLGVEGGIDHDVDVVRSAERFARIESSLLYLFAKYDACAAGVLGSHEQAPGEDADLVDVAAAWAFLRLEQLCRLRSDGRLTSEFEYELYSADDLSPSDLERDTVARLYVELGISAVEFSSWLIGVDESGLETALDRLDTLVNALALDQTSLTSSVCGYDYGRIFHIATLLRLSINGLSERALRTVVPNPSHADSGIYQDYLRRRAAGDSKSHGRPVLWPSALRYVERCLHGKDKHAVVSMPTGSGKSFVAELAVSHAVHDGWVLYLAPTNALTEQIRGDLRVALKALETEIFAFIGDQEYSIFSADTVEAVPPNSVAVMTPEKCALALRLAPDAFSNCRLVVFDECHLIGDTNSTRGPVAELVLTQLMLRTSNCRFLLMSAIVQNPEELAGWLGDATGEEASAVTVRWRPTRTLRAVLGLDNNSIQDRAEDAISQLKTKAERTKRKSFKSKCAMAASLQGAWQSEETEDYAVVPIDCEAPLKVLRKKAIDGDWNYYWEGDSWVNSSACILGRSLAESAIQTLIFTPASKHYPFSNGKKVKLSAQLLDSVPDSSGLVDVCRTLAEYELGCTSQVFELLDVGVAVHTSLMLETEKIAAESMFRSRSAPIMFATGTLAQGLNLPAIAVIIAGSRIGDPRGQKQEDVQRRKFSQLLNAAGRAGRAGFANQGLVVAIPDRPVAFEGIETFTEARDQVDYLQQSDDSVSVQSGLSEFLDSVCENTLRSDQANDVELQVISLLVGGDSTQIEPEPVLRKTFAAYLRRQAGDSEVTSDDAGHLEHISTQFIQETGAPEWLTIAAQRAGLDFFLTLAISQAWARVRPQLPDDIAEWDVRAWRNELLNLIVYIPPGLLSKQISIGSLKHISDEFKEIEKDNPDYLANRELNWNPPAEWLAAWTTAAPPLEAWMTGKSFAEIAGLILGEPVEDLSHDRTAGKPIPKALSLSHDAWSSLALVAGGFLAVAEQVLPQDVPLMLASLPMCIKYGCDSPGTLAWFRFGVRLRRPSRLLAATYPPPLLTTDDELKEWVSQTRREWLAEEGDASELMAAIRAFITND